jgi:hypothetical protein
VLSDGLARLGLRVDLAPAAHDALDVLCSTGTPHRQQPLLGLGRGHAGECAHLGIGELAAAERLGEPGQRAEGAGDAHVLAGSAGRKADPPGEPGGARSEAAVPTAAGVELADEVEQASGGRVESWAQRSMPDSSFVLG